jgi:HAD superfamily hydrolase (TIGR01509 family)
VAFESVFFDLDGTLVDTTYLHTYAWWRALDEAGFSVPMVEIHPLIGMGGSELLLTLLGHDDEAVSESHGCCFASLHASIRPLPGARELIRRIAESGRQVVIVTSAKEADLCALMRPLDSEEVVSDIVFGEMADRSKPSPDLFEVALDRARIRPGQVLAIGDARWDVTAAGRAGIACLGLESGGTNSFDLLSAGADHVYRSCADLLEQWPTTPLDTGSDR